MAAPKWQVPPFWGQTGEKYKAWRARVVWAAAATADAKQNLIAPQIIQGFSGDPEELFRDKDPAEFRHDKGLDKLLSILDARYGDYAEIELCSHVITFFYKTRRSQGETATSFASRFRTALQKLERLVTKEMDTEVLSRNTAATQKYKEQTLYHNVSMQLYVQERAAADAAFQSLPQ